VGRQLGPVVGDRVVHRNGTWQSLFDCDQPDLLSRPSCERELGSEDDCGEPPGSRSQFLHRHADAGCCTSMT